MAFEPDPRDLAARSAFGTYLPGDWYWMDSDPDHPLCRLLDRRADIDAIVLRHHGAIEFVAWRWQINYLEDTVTIRYQTDKGNQSQWQKILRGQSLPSWYVHAYGEGTGLYGWMVERGAMQRYAWSLQGNKTALAAHIKPGKDGQQLVIIRSSELVRAVAVRWGHWSTRTAAA